MGQNVQTLQDSGTKFDLAARSSRVGWERISLDAAIIEQGCVHVVSPIHGKAM